ncbi:HNH endonuclease [Jatrophihabitans telluris]|uniref:HNH endonuclease n=1 Tax=Jatrophihabitans telluris TaxID=2038343 RepID=A0ABY4QYJ9_9ACTN|nr:HNH endonuclease signature motif containing protein [Jatrophihabitans telluris]UQX88071.1 HNH endonuclease [Jatrophihabitans telluris]
MRVIDEQTAPAAVGVSACRGVGDVVRPGTGRSAREGVGSGTNAERASEGSAAVSYLAEAVSGWLGWAASAGLSGLSTQALLSELRAMETTRRRLEAIDVALVAELDNRAVASTVAARSTADLLSSMLHVSRAEARRRASAAGALGPRADVIGDALPPVVPELASALAAGEVSAEHVRVVLATLEKVPAELGAFVFEQAATTLTNAARSTNPRELGLTAQRLLDTVDSDGTVSRDAIVDRRRAVSLTPVSDGSWRLRGELTAGCGQLLWAFLDSRSAPRPSDESGRDERSAAQRMHDALDDAAGILARHRGPAESGAPATVLITASRDSLRSPGGVAIVEAGSGQPMPVASACHLADEAELAVVVSDARGAILNFGRARRIASRSQTLALITRDKGCTFPGCDAPPSWTQRHHIRAWRDGGTTDLNNLTLVCHYHHREFGPRGWTCRMIDGLPAWVPPRSIDPLRLPRFNRRVSAHPRC